MPRKFPGNISTVLTPEQKEYIAQRASLVQKWNSSSYVAAIIAHWFSIGAPAVHAAETYVNPDVVPDVILAQLDSFLTAKRGKLSHQRAQNAAWAASLDSDAPAGAPEPKPEPARPSRSARKPVQTAP